MRRCLPPHTPKVADFWPHWAYPFQGVRDHSLGVTKLLKEWFYKNFVVTKTVVTVFIFNVIIAFSLLLNIKLAFH